MNCLFKTDVEFGFSCNFELDVFTIYPFCLDESFPDPGKRFCCDGYNLFGFHTLVEVTSKQRK